MFGWAPLSIQNNEKKIRLSTWKENNAYQTEQLTVGGGIVGEVEGVLPGLVVGGLWP